MMRFIYTIFFIVSCVLLFGSSVSALTVAPAVTEVELDPGTSIEREVTVFNETDQPMTVSAQIESFVPRGEQGAAQTVNDGNQALRWVQLGQSTVSVAPRTAQTVPVLISVPKTASVGGYYLAVLWQQATPGGSEVNLNGRVGALFLVTVKGEVKRSLSISDFDVQSDGVSDPLRVMMSIHNDGNVHVKPHGLVVIKNIFNRVVATVPINPENGNVLPQSTRKFEVMWPSGALSVSDLMKRLTMIRASVYAEIEYEGGAKLISSEHNIWTAPLSALGVMFIALFVIMIFIWFMVKKNKKLQA